MSFQLGWDSLSSHTPYDGAPTKRTKGPMPLFFLACGENKREKEGTTKGWRASSEVLSPLSLISLS